FRSHLEEMYVTWTQFEKKQDKIATLHEDDEELACSAWRRLLVTASKLSRDDVRICGDSV
nr:hypothetical protein [Tanacetum cinerariifolium]